MKKSITDILSEALGITEGSTQLATGRKKNTDNANIPFRKIGTNTIGYYETKFEAITIIQEENNTKLKYSSKEIKDKSQDILLEDQVKLLEQLDGCTVQDDKKWC